MTGLVWEGKQDLVEIIDPSLALTRARSSQLIVGQTLTRDLVVQVLHVFLHLEKKEHESFLYSHSIYIWTQHMEWTHVVLNLRVKWTVNALEIPCSPSPWSSQPECCTCPGSSWCAVCLLKPPRVEASGGRAPTAPDSGCASPPWSQSDAAPPKRTKEIDITLLWFLSGAFFWVGNPHTVPCKKYLPRSGFIFSTHKDFSSPNQF